MTDTMPNEDLQNAEALASISFAGSMFAGAIASIRHHEIGDDGSWDCWGTPEQEIARLTRSLDRMEAAIGGCSCRTADSGPPPIGRRFRG